MNGFKLMATLWPDFPHYSLFAHDSRLNGIRLNSATITCEEFEADLKNFQPMLNSTMPLYFDVKGRQLRITEVLPNQEYLDIRINHPIKVKTPIKVFFKGGTDYALLLRIEEDGRRLIFQDGPDFVVMPGESIHIHDPNLVSWGPQFIESELRKISIAREAGFTRFFQSYVQSGRDVDEFRELVGPDSLIMLKIEDKKGLEYVAKEFKKQDNLVLVVARGDLFVELNRPSKIISAQKLIIEKDQDACIGSRLMLSVQQPTIPQIRRAFNYIVKHHPDQDKVDEIMQYLMSPRSVSCADLCELTWLADLGYRNFMLCDELCLHKELLESAIVAFDELINSYVRPKNNLVPRNRAPFHRSDFLDNFPQSLLRK